MQLETTANITIVEDDPVMGESLVQSLSLEGYDVEWCETSGDALNRLQSKVTNLVICDIKLPDGSGEALFQEFSCHCHNGSAAPPFLFMTGYGDIDQAVRLMRAGAGDYLTKPFDMGDFLNRVQLLIASRHMVESKDQPLLGVSRAMRTIEQAIRRLSNSSQPLLLTGEVGVGKEFCARLLHELSPRRNQPFIAVNCAVIPQDILARELFGDHIDARRISTKAPPPYVQRTAGGTLYLDGLGQLPPVLQSKLLRLMEEGSYDGAGGETSQTFDGRLVFATRQDLSLLVDQSEFRADLWHKVGESRLHIPPLRDRIDDISMHVEQCLNEFEPVSMGQNHGLSAAAEKEALDYNWPYNVAELRNRMERAMALALGDWITPMDLFPERGFGSWKGQPEVTSLAAAREMAERRQIERALALHDGHLSKAAKTLGVSRTTLWEKIKRLGLTQAP